MAGTYNDNMYGAIERRYHGGFANSEVCACLGKYVALSLIFILSRSRRKKYFRPLATWFMQVACHRTSIISIIIFLVKCHSLGHFLAASTTPRLSAWSRFHAFAPKIFTCFALLAMQALPWLPYWDALRSNYHGLACRAIVAPFQR